MSKEKEITLKLNIKTALEVLQILDTSTANYSHEFAPERITRLREVIRKLDIELDKAVA